MHCSPESIRNQSFEMKVQTRLLALVPLLLCAVAHSSRAQTQEGGGGTQVRPWSVAIGGQQSYESGSQFSSGGESSGGLTSRGLTARLGRTWTLRRGGIDANGDASQLIYGGGQPDRIMYGVAGSGSYSLTRRFTWRASGSMNNSYARDSSVLTESGIILQNNSAMTKTYIASTETTYALSPRSTITASVAHTQVAFDGDESLTNGSSLATRAAYTRDLTRTQSLSVSFGNTFSSGLTGDIQGLLASWHKKVGQGLTVSLGGGVRPYTLYGETGRRIAPGLSAGVTGRVNSRQTLSLTYERAVEQAFGFNRTHLAHRVNANHELLLGRRFQVGNTLNYGLNTYPQIANYTLGGWTYSISSRYLIAANLAVTGSYGFWLTQETGVPSLSSFRTVAGLSYGFGWR